MKPTTIEEAYAQIDSLVVSVIVPQLYAHLDTLLTCAAKGEAPPKETVVAVRRLLPSQYANSFSRKE